jgi:K+-sensing histidine kinase KdpD
VAEEVIRYVREAGVTFIVMGQSARSRLEEVSRLHHQPHHAGTRNIDIVVVADANGGATEPGPGPPGD